MQRWKSHYVERIGFLIPSAFPYWFKGQIRAWKFTYRVRSMWTPDQHIKVCFVEHSSPDRRVAPFAVIINSTLLERLSIFWSVAVVICAYLATRARVGSGEES